MLLVCVVLIRDMFILTTVELHDEWRLFGWLVCRVMLQQHASVCQGRICSNKCMCCHFEIEVPDQTFYLTQSQYTDTRPTSPSADPMTSGARQGRHWSAGFQVTGISRPEKIRRNQEWNHMSSAPEVNALTTKPTRRSMCTDTSLAGDG